MFLGMIIRSVRHQGLRALIDENSARGLSGDLADRIENVIAALLVASNVEDIEGPPGWRIHQLTGDRAGTWSISVSGNWRITFEVEKEEIINLDLEGYH